MIACHAAASRDLTRTQAEGQACIRCGTPGAGELIPVGVIIPPRFGDGIARHASYAPLSSLHLDRTAVL
jgi:hypothetical protein